MNNKRIFNLGFGNDDPEIAALGTEIRRLQKKRDELILDKLLGRTRTEIGGFPIVTDPSVPRGEIQIRDSIAGRVVGRIVGLDEG